MTQINLGNAFVTLQDLQSSGEEIKYAPNLLRGQALLSEHVRLSLQPTNSGGQSAGFITVTSWPSHGEKVSSTNSSPSHIGHTSEDMSYIASQAHKRCQSLPAAENNM